MDTEANGKAGSDKKATVTLAGTVEKIIPSLGGTVPEKAQIGVDGADPLYKEIRVENTLHDAKGNPVALKVGSEVQVKIEAPPEAIKHKN